MSMYWRWPPAGAPFARLKRIRRCVMDADKVVTVYVEGGVVHDVIVPEGMVVVVRDYDIEGVDPERLHMGVTGKQFVESKWFPGSEMTEGS